MRTIQLSCFVVFLTSTGSGCSALFVKPPSPMVGQQLPPDCTESNVAPALDLVFAGFEALVTLGWLANGLPEAALISGGVGTLFAWSGSTGLVNTRKCRNKIRLWTNQRKPEGYSPPSFSGGCRYDNDCKGIRICVSGGCQNP
jgi:hypothetical protein